MNYVKRDNCTENKLIVKNTRTGKTAAVTTAGKVSTSAERVIYLHQLHQNQASTADGSPRA